MPCVCETCGDQGFEEALVYCDSCKRGAVHRYCLGTTPVPFHDYITWLCAHCDESDSGSDSNVSSSPSKETTTMEYCQRQQSSCSGKPNGVVEHGASSSPEGGVSHSVADHNSCSANIEVTSENRHSFCKEDGSNLNQTNGIGRALPIFKPIWRGTISVKNGKISSIDGLVAHLSSLACVEVHDKVSLLHVLLSAEMFPRLEIWPSRFLDKGQPTDKSIALYFFPSSESDETVYYSLLREMKKNDMAMRCVLDNVDLLLFTSYQLPLHCWTFHSKEYLWGIFRRRKTSRS